jgi:hypothetical protein
MGENEVNSAETFPPSGNVVGVLNVIWDLIEKHGLTAGKSIPAAKLFTPIMKGGSQKLGQYKNNTVYIHTDMAEDRGPMLLQTMLEEVVHHVTGAGDGSRDLQDFLFRLVVSLAFGQTPGNTN